MKKVIIPTLRFPPAGGVGLRRIIKMGKKMAESGVEVHYITTENSSQINSYSRDIKHPNIHVNKIPSLSLNNYLNKYKENIVEKGISKLVYYITMPLFFVDYATWWGVVLVPYVYRYVKKEEIKNIYVSGPAFSTLFYMAILKKIMPHDINLLCEWRDYWTDDYERQYLPPKIITKRIQKWMENFTINNSDMVLAVTMSLLESLKRGDMPDKYKLIENGFDRGDFSYNSSHVCNARNPHYTICYTGNVVDTRAEGLYLFLDFLKKYNNSGIVFEFCGELGHSVKKHIKHEYKDLLDRGDFVYHGVVSVSAAIQLVERSNFGLVLVQRQHPEALTSKFFEYCYARKPVIAIGPSGDLQDKMKHTEVGIFCELDDFSENAIMNFILKAQEEEMNFDEIITKNDFTHLAKLLGKELK